MLQSAVLVVPLNARNMSCGTAYPRTGSARRNLYSCYWFTIATWLDVHLPCLTSKARMSNESAIQIAVVLPCAWMRWCVHALNLFPLDFRRRFCAGTVDPLLVVKLTFNDFSIDTVRKDGSRNEQYQTIQETSHVRSPFEH